jgi:hypothetical protein
MSINFSSIDLSEYDFSNIQTVQLPDEIPFIQIINPKGLAIKKEQADLIGFQPSALWKKQNHDFDDGTTEEVFICSEFYGYLLDFSRGEDDRYITYLRDKKTGALFPFSKEKYYKSKESYEVFSYLVLALADEKGNIISDTPVRLKISKGSTIDLQKGLFDWAKKGKRVWDSITSSLSLEQKVKLGDFKFSTYFFQVKFGKKKNEYNKAVVSVDAITELTPDNLFNYLINPKKQAESYQKLKEQIESCRGWCNPAINPIKQDDSSVDRNELLTEIADKFNSLNYSKEEKDEFLASYFELSLSELTENELVTASSLLDNEISSQQINKQKVPF